mmetsp:Transcript_4743/g.15558  ORF Transcript_4743/g.15558 Transcript_4743/m.15558 type:complete len:273 (+) Transcript_4743:770-1588(+)
MRPARLRYSRWHRRTTRTSACTKRRVRAVRAKERAGARASTEAVHRQPAALRNGEPGPVGCWLVAAMVGGRSSGPVWAGGELLRACAHLLRASMVRGPVSRASSTEQTSLLLFTAGSWPFLLNPAPSHHSEVRRANCPTSVGWPTPAPLQLPPRRRASSCLPAHRRPWVSSLCVCAQPTSGTINRKAAARPNLMCSCSTACRPSATRPRLPLRIPRAAIHGLRPHDGRNDRRSIRSPGPTPAGRLHAAGMTRSSIFAGFAWRSTTTTTSCCT